MAIIPLKLLCDLRALFKSWGIDPDDWYITGEAAMLLNNYPVEFRAGNMDILLFYEKWPWKRSEEQASLLPNRDTRAEQEFHAFIAKHSMTPDIHPLPHVGLRAEDRFAHTAWYPDESGVRALQPWAGIVHRQNIIEFYESDTKHGLAAFDEAKFIRWKRFVSEVVDHAAKIGDADVLKVAPQVFAAIDRAINFFNKDLKQDNGNSLQGKGVNTGVVQGPVQHWQDNTDFSGKIAVLTHSLPNQVTLLRFAKGIITDQGGTLSHAATIAREYNIPTIIGTQIATQVLKNGDMVKMDAEKGAIIRL